MNENIKIKKYYEFLVEENKKYNLTRIIDYNEYLEKHIKDSLLGIDFVKGRVLDIGSGAGFPAIVLKIFNDDLNITMIEGTNKKVNFLKKIIENLELKGIEAIHERIENYNKKEEFDTVTARAVAPLRTLVEYALPFLKIGGWLIAYKSDKIEEEIKESKNAIDEVGGKIEKIIEKKLNEETTREIVIIKKIKKTDKKYPRGQNKPRKDPL